MTSIKISSAAVRRGRLSPAPSNQKRSAKAKGTPLAPIVLKRLYLRCGDWTVRELRVNRHLQPFDRESPHRHSHGQLLVYLRGRGEQHIRSKHYTVAPGAVFFIPPGTEHAFLEKAPRLAICLVADLGGAGPVRLGTASGWLPAEELARMRERINQLAHEGGERAEKTGTLELGAGGIALLLLESCRRACLSTAVTADDGSFITRKLLRSIDPGGLVPAPGELARRTGLQPDYLNRLVRRSTGLTLGQWRAQQLLKACEHHLARGGAIGAAALQLGFSDANYFSRWFRRQTGMTPRAWRERSSGRPAPGTKRRA